jgi:hypothetical protein
MYIAPAPTVSAPPSSWYLRLLLRPMCSDQQAALPSTLGGSFTLTYVGSSCCLQEGGLHTHTHRDAAAQTHSAVECRYSKGDNKT